MPTKKTVAPVLAMVLGLVGSVAIGAEKDIDWTFDELYDACEASLGVCFASCKKGGGFTGYLQEEFCKDDCQKSFAACASSIGMRKGLKGTVGTGNLSVDPGSTPGAGGAGGTLTPGPFGPRTQKNRVSPTR
jgi:hypothetical protein